MTRSPIARATTFVLAWTLLCVATAHAQWVSNGTIVSTAGGVQGHPTIVPDGAGGALIAWDDSRSGTIDIYAQRMSATGVRTWGNKGLPACVAPGEQNSPIGTADGAGGILLIWDDLRRGNPSPDLYATRLTGAGAAVAGWPADGVVVRIANKLALRQHALAGDGSGGAFVVWTEMRDTVAQRVDLFALHLTPAGGIDPAWPATGLSVASAVDNGSPPVALTDGAGGVFLGWTDTNVRLQRLTGAGAIASGWPAGGRLVGGTPESQNGVAIVSDDAGGAVLAWIDSRAGDRLAVYAQRVSGAGVPAWTGDGVPVCVQHGVKGQIILCADGAHGGFVFWNDSNGGGSISTDMYAQHVDAAGAMVSGWPAGGLGVVTGQPFGRSPSGVVSDGGGGATLLWRDSRVGSDDLYALHVTGAGAPAPGWNSGGQVVCGASYSQFDAVATTDGAGGAIMTWIDNRYTEYDVYARGVPSGGLPAGVQDSDAQAGGLSIERPWPNPGRDVIGVAFTLPDASPARLEVLDLAGRRMEWREVGTLGPGRHVERMHVAGTLRPGIYRVRLRQLGGRAVERRVCVIE